MAGAVPSGAEPPPALVDDGPHGDLALLIDFGSTYTKAAAVDLERQQILGWSQASTTGETDITIGLKRALYRLRAAIGCDPLAFEHKSACSSAQGGLRMVAIGLVPELTAEAAHRAALGAGARVLGLYSHKLIPTELQRIVGLAPDMILLAGGTDGGDSRVILHNARALASARLQAPIVVAGNKEVSEKVAHVLRSSGKEVRLTENVMPCLGELNVEPARAAIRQLFVEHIVEAKGLKQAEAFVQGVLMPTPDAVLRAARLLADGTDQEPGLGELLVVDVGGATTDVDSIADGSPANDTVLQRGLPEPYAKRTVEGDLGLRVSALSLLEAVGKRRLEQHIGLETLALEDAIHHRANEHGFVPRTERSRSIDEGIAKAAIELSVKRHVGTLREFHLPAGYCFMQEGKDLTRVQHLVGTGGIFCHTNQSRPILQCALFEPGNPMSLKPQAPCLWIDKRYILWAAGLLSEVAPNTALRLMRRNLEEV